MKILLTVMIGVLFPLYGFAQQYVAEAKTGNSDYKRLTIEIRNNIAYTTRAAAAFNSNTTASVNDFANLGIQNGKFTVPDDGSSYWLIPFEGGSAVKISGGTWCIDCVCEGQGGQSAYCNLRNNTCGGSCGACTTVIKPCGGSESYQGAMAIVKASQVVFE